MNDEIKEFCYKYNAYVCESSRMHKRLKRASFAAWNDPEIYNEIPYEAVKCVEVHMPEDRFRALVEHDEWLYRARYNSFSHTDKTSATVEIAKQYEKECRIRHENPAVQAAYEKYQNLLGLVDSYYE